MTNYPNIRVVSLCLYLLLLAILGDGLSAAPGKPSGTMLVVGGTGSTGFRALRGLLDVGFRPSQIRILTRNAESSKSDALRNAGFGVVQADLEDLTSLQEKEVTRGCVGCYVHSTTSDTAELDRGGVDRARNLAVVIENENNQIRHIVYNSAAAHENHGVERIQQKHDVEDVFEKTVKGCNANRKEGSDQVPIAFTSLRANIFMEESWKKYTRPSILDGVYPLPLRSSRKIYLVSVRDLGRLAGTIIMDSNKTRADGNEEITKINVAGDYLCPNEMAKAFAEAQGSPCRHRNPRWMTLTSYFFFPQLYQLIKFLQTSTLVSDVDGLREKFPHVMTSFPQFLTETHWEDRDRTFEDFSDIRLLVEV